MLLRVLRPVTYLGSSLFALAILVKNDQARKASKPFQLSQVVVPPKDVAHVREAAARLGIPHTQNIFVVCSRSLSGMRCDEMAADVGAARVGRDVCEGGLESLQAHEDAVIAVTGNPPLWPSPTHPPLRWRQAALRRILKEYDA
ncbi:hypothetical protein PTSG_00207 [Salpingoeca rosetta]|uniref:Uncharacterized protein n=1 Tax=Salpingoeca rosetta (strain ATCC 50818 / BSB-021) TaxID=946362 RepID=F2TVT9_SALR5|nr:uncharacterized protein PTSG_00207 [Salpingoeca rosetta]EGD72185.1 hypothetical protein PTSG_00207 [Salpingoeca rosetta]|eukprot:XP_004998756.1 hypothetical protein PTSG_00207 [Salpingoeca rosetta]